MTEPLIRYPFIKDNDKKVPTDLQNKLIRDLIDVGWMSDKGLKWFGWDVNGWYAWTDANGMIYRIRDLKRNEDGKRFEKEVTKIIRVDEPRNDIRASANELYQHEFNLCVDCQLCPDRSGVSDSYTDTNTSTDGGGGEKEEEKVNVTAPPWETFAGGGTPDYGGINTGSNPNVPGANYGGYGDIYTEYTPPTADPGETIKTEGVTDTSKTAGGSNTPAKEGGKTTTSIDVTKSPAAPPPKQYIPGGSKSNEGGFIWDGKQGSPAKVLGSVGTYGVVPTYQPPNIPHIPKPPEKKILPPEKEQPKKAPECLYFGQSVSKEFRDKVKLISKELEVDPNHLMTIMAFETARTFSPSKKNAAGSSGTGLIQFMKSTALSLGTTTKQLSEMTAVNQLDYVKKYLSSFKGKIKTLEDAYMAVLKPTAVGKSNEHVIFKIGTKEYEQNKGLDINNDGKITKKEVSAKIRELYLEGEKLKACD